MIFYHGGCEPDFIVEKIDVLRIAEKQQKHNRNYAGFYMYEKIIVMVLFIIANKKI